MNPDLKKIYIDVKEYVEQYGLLENEVNIRVEEDLFIKIYIDDVDGINGQFKKPLMIIYFSAPGRLTAKLVLEKSKFIELSESFKLSPLERGTYRIDFLELKEFEKFIGSI